MRCMLSKLFWLPLFEWPLLPMPPWEPKRDAEKFWGRGEGVSGEGGGVEERVG